MVVELHVPPGERHDANGVIGLDAGPMAGHKHSSKAHGRSGSHSRSDSAERSGS